MRDWTEEVRACCIDGEVFIWWCKLDYCTAKASAQPSFHNAAYTISSSIRFSSHKYASTRAIKPHCYVVVLEDIETSLASYPTPTPTLSCKAINLHIPPPFLHHLSLPLPPHLSLNLPPHPSPSPPPGSDTPDSYAQPHAQRHHTQCRSTAHKSRTHISHSH